MCPERRSIQTWCTSPAQFKYVSIILDKTISFFSPKQKPTSENVKSEADDVENYVNDENLAKFDSENAEKTDVADEPRIIKSEQEIEGNNFVQQV